MAQMMGLNGVNAYVTDVCGHELDTNHKLNETEREICLRWTELAAFLPQMSIRSGLLDRILTLPASE